MGNINLRDLPFALNIIEKWEIWKSIAERLGPTPTYIRSPEGKCIYKGFKQLCISRKPPHIL